MAGSDRVLKWAIALIALCLLFVGCVSEPAGTPPSRSQAAAVLWSRSSVVSHLPPCSEPTDAELHEAVRREFELKRGIPEEVAFAIMSKESSLRHCEGGVVKLNNSGSGLTDGGTGFCQITPVGMETLAAVTNNAIAQTDWAHHLEQCAAALDQKWIVANRGNCAVATAGSCVERELLEEWLWPIALFNGAPPLSLKSKYVADVAAFMADPIDPHVVPVTVSNPESCIDGFQFRVDANGHLSAYLTGDMFKKGCALHGAAQWRAPLSYTGIQLKLTSGWGTGALSGYHVNARAVDVGVATETVRQWGIPLLCPFDVGCEVRAGGSASGPYWIRFRRADGFAEFVGRGGYEVLHINGVNDGLSCRGALPDSSRTFTAAFGDVMGYTARPGEKGYGASDPGAGPHGHVAKCQESAWEQTSSCYGSAEPFALKFSGAVYSSDALRQSVLGSTFVTGLEMPDEGQGALPSNYSEDASTCCMAGCEALPGACPSGDGDYCGEGVALTAGTLYHCEGGVFSVKSVCTSGCHVAPSGQDDTCNVGTEPTITITSPLPGTALVRGATILLTYSSQGFDAVQPLSMRVVAIDNSNVELTPTIAAQAGLNDSIPVTIPASWPNQIRLCVSSNAKPVSTCVGPLQVVDAPTSCANGDGDYCGEAAGLTAGTLYHCEGGVFSVKLVCTAGCHIAGTGQNDSCNPEPQCYPEICNGVDDDCDGVIDEQLTRACSSACGDGVETCVAGQWQGCTAPSQCTQPLRYRIKWSAPVTVVNAIAIKDYPWSTVCVADNATPKTEVECDAAEAPHQFYWESQASWTTDPNAKVWSCGWSTPAPPQACLPFGSVGVEDTVAGISVQYTLQLLSVPGSVDKQCRHVMN